MEPLRIDYFGEWSYAVALAPYFLILLYSVWHFRVILQFANWKFFILTSCLCFLVLGLAFEWIAGMLYVWTFPEGRDLFWIPIPLFGWITGNRIPICELLWIAIVIPLFYYLYFWATLVFNDIIYVVDENGDLYKREERWVGFFGDTHVAKRLKGRRGQENETVLHTRPPGFVARTAKRFRRDSNVPKA